MIRMELYRMFRTKSFYVIGLVLTAAIVFTTHLAAVEMKSFTMEEKQEQYEYAMEQQGEESINIGMVVTVPTEPGAEISVFDLFYANLKGKFIALFIVIFTVLYSSADMTSGYIKNIAGQVKNRGYLVLAKAVSLFIYVGLMILFFAGVQAVSNAILFDSFVWGPWKAFLTYGGMQILLHFAYALIAMCITIVLRNNVISMLLVVCICMNVLTIVYSAIDNMIGRLGVKAFHVIDYTISGKIAFLPMEITVEEVRTTCFVAIAFWVVTLFIGEMVFRKRDI